MNMMFMSAYIPCGSNGQRASPDAIDSSHKGDKHFPATPTPMYPFGLYGGDILPHPFLVPDLFYPFPLAPGLYPHFGGVAGNIRSAEKDDGDSAIVASKGKEMDKELNFGIESILKSSQQHKESLKERKKDQEKESEKTNNNNNNNKIPTDFIKTEKSPSSSSISSSSGSPQSETIVQRPAPHTFLQSPYPLGLPPLHPALAPQYSFSTPHHPYGLFERRGDSGRSHCNPKRKRSWSRAVFSALQRKGLEKRFEVQKYVTKPDRRQLAAVLGLTDAQVKVWFQNRRMKWRHMEEQRKKREQEEQRQKHSHQKHQTKPSGDGHTDRQHLENKEDNEEHVHVTDSEPDSDMES